MGLVRILIVMLQFAYLVKKMQYRFVICFFFCLLIFSGCQTPFANMSLPQSFIEKKSKIGIIWIKDSEKHTGDLYADVKESGAGCLCDLISLGVAHATSTELANRIRMEETAPLVKKHYLNVFSDAFSVDGFEVKPIDNAYDKKSLLKFEINKSDAKNEKKDLYYSYRLKSVSEELQTDYIMVLESIRFGVKTEYSGPIMSGIPKGITSLKCYLVEGSSNKIIAQHSIEITELPGGKWDEPPEYPLLIKAAKISFEKAMDQTFIGIFQRAP